MTTAPPNAEVPPFVDPPLDDEAMMSAPPSGSLAERLAKGKSAAQVVSETKTTGARRGRPPGSRNKPRVPPTNRTLPRNESSDLTQDQKHEHKLGRAEVLTTQVSSAINDNIASLLLMAGVPPEMVYKEGHIPKEVIENEKYQPIVASLMMPNQTAKSIGRFLAEMETTDVGGKFGSAVTDGKAPLIVYGLFSALGILQWGKQSMDTINKLKPLMDAYQAQQNVRAQQEQTREHANQTGGR